MADEAEQRGELRGRVMALEDRVTEFRSEAKADFRTMDGKLDLVISRLDRADGASAKGARVGDFAKAIAGGACGAVLGWLAQHVGIKP